MLEWYTVKVKYTKQMQDGQLKRVNEPYLVSAVSFTDAEARIYEEVGEYVKGEFLINNIAKTAFTDIFHYEEDEDWYKCKMTYQTTDDNGKEKKVNSNLLVSAGNVKEAYERIYEILDSLMVPFELPTIAKSPIVDVFPYKDEDKIIDNEEKVVAPAPVEEEDVALDEMPPLDEIESNNEEEAGNEDLVEDNFDKGEE